MAIKADRPQDWYTATISRAKLICTPSDQVAMTDAFEVLKKHLLAHRHVVLESRDKFQDILDTYANRPKVKLTLEQVAATIDVYQFIYSVLRDEAYERQSLSMLELLNEVHAGTTQ